MRHSDEKGFCFLDLPLEVRNAIYSAILCSPPPARLRCEAQGDLSPTIPQLDYITHPQETQILRLNRQIHSEAQDVLLRGNQFVRVRVSSLGAMLQQIMEERQIPIVRTTAEFRARYKGFALTHTIGWTGPRVPHSLWPDMPPREADDDIVILRRDLDEFCAALASRAPLCVWDFWRSSSHTVEVHNPFEGTLSPDFMGEKNQARLLEPYREHVRGLVHFSVHGHVSDEVAKSLSLEVTNLPVPEPEQVLKELLRKKDQGNSHFRQREFLLAAGAYAAGVNDIVALRNGPAWEKIVQKGGPVFIRNMAEVFYLVCLNATQNILTHVREGPFDDPPDHPEGPLSKAEAYVFAAERVGWLLETDWRPNLAQMAKASYRMATVQRAMGRMEQARTCIVAARHQAPWNPLIRQEAEEIESLVRSQAGLGRLLA